MNNSQHPIMTVTGIRKKAVLVALDFDGVEAA